MDDENINLGAGRNGWKLTAIILIAVSVILAGTTTWFVIQSARKQADNDESSQTDSTPPDGDDPASGPDEPIPSDMYLVVSEWGLKFKIPTGFTELSYEITDNRLNFKGSLTAEHWHNGAIGISDFSINSAIDEFMYIIRHPKDNDPSAECKASCFQFIITSGDYNYYMGGAQNRTYKNQIEELQAVIAGYLLTQMAFNVTFI